MTGSVELDTDGAHLLIRFPYREDLVAAVKELPGRRWDPKQKTWRVPSARVEEVYALFTRHLFHFAPEVSTLLAGTLGDPVKARTEAAPRRPSDQLPFAGPAAPVAADETPAALSVSALNLRVRDALRAQFPQTFWVVGEVVDYDKQTGRQHRFFSLVEKAPGESRPRARVEAALFERTAEALRERFAAQAADFSLRDGIEIRALVRVDLYLQSGRFQVVVEDVDPSFTLGKLALTREQILRELRALDLADRNRSLALPVPPLRVGVLTSPDSDGWSDFLRHLQESRVGFELTLVPIKVQGPRLRPSVVAGLRWFADRAADFDVLCILRGGGSRTELAGFDDRELALAVARHPLKVLVGIGHQRDQSVLDAIAHSEKTPTAVAEFLVRCVEDERAAVRREGGRLLAAVNRLLAAARGGLAHGGHGLQRAVAARLQRERSFLGTAARDLGRESQRRLAAATAELARAARDLHGRSVRRCERARSRLQFAVERGRRAAALRLERARSRLDHQAARQRLLDPARVLARGFAVVRTEDGRVLVAAACVHPPQTLVLQLRDGTVRSRAESVRLDPAP